MDSNRDEISFQIKHPPMAGHQALAGRQAGRPRWEWGRNELREKEVLLTMQTKPAETHTGSAEDQRGNRTGLPGQWDSAVRVPMCFVTRKQPHRIGEYWVRLCSNKTLRDAALGIPHHFQLSPSILFYHHLSI